MTGFVYIYYAPGIGAYPGSTARTIELRKKENEAALRSGRHHNHAFQEAALSFGVEAFSFHAFGPFEGASEIAKAEQECIDAVKAAGERLFNKHQKLSAQHRAGYTLTEEARERQSLGKRKHYEFVSPEGETVVAHGLRELCAERHLSASEMCRVANGQKRAHKGWTSAKSATANIENLKKAPISSKEEVE